MAEFCPECWININHLKESASKYRTSRDLDLCEGCGEWKHVVVGERYFTEQLAAELMEYVKKKLSR